MNTYTYKLINAENTMSITASNLNESIEHLKRGVKDSGEWELIEVEDDGKFTKTDMVLFGITCMNYISKQSDSIRRDTVNYLLSNYQK